MNRPVQYFSDEYLEQCLEMPSESVMEFIENFRTLHAEGAKPVKAKLISIKIPQDLLETFRSKAELEGLAYQTQIKILMREWVK